MTGIVIPFERGISVDDLNPRHQLRSSMGRKELDGKISSTVICGHELLRRSEVIGPCRRCVSCQGELLHPATILVVTSTWTLLELIEMKIRHTVES